MAFDRSTSSSGLRARTRAALGQLMGDVLSAPLGALETHLSRSSWLRVRRGAASAAEGRLREVLDRDRALVATQPKPSPEPTPAVAMAVQSGAALPLPNERVPDAAPEPIRTRTMARLLAAQGYRARALAIYEALSAESPDDRELLAEMERLRALPA